MLTLVEALRYRSLRDVRIPLSAFHVLVGPNATGKTTLMDVIAFLGTLVHDGPEAAIGERVEDPRDLTWRRNGTEFQLAIEVRIPDSLRSRLPDKRWDTARYEVALDVAPEVRIQNERLMLKPRDTTVPVQLDVFPSLRPTRESLLSRSGSKEVRSVVVKVPGGNDRFASETAANVGKSWMTPYKLGPRRSALGNLPEDETKFPVATWLKGFLADGVQRFVLNSLLIRKASAPSQEARFKPDGSNLPWVVNRLERSRAKEDKRRLSNWLAHLRTALPDLEGVRTVERKDDRHRYLMLKYRGGSEIPSWLASDGTLRLLALTLPAYLPDLSGIFLIEEPENGIHPRAVEAAFQSLNSMYDAQVIAASHSPVVLGLAKPSDVLCFAKDAEGATDVVRGTEHPALKRWKGETSLGTLFAGGVLG